MKATIHSGACGFSTTVTAETDKKYKCTLQIESKCPHITKMSQTLGTVNAMDELFKKGQSQVLSASSVHLPHATCPVGIGILKVVEASAKLALPKDATIEFEK